MSLLTPLSLLFGLLAVPILILYMLKLRRREVEVSSTLLWRRLLLDRQANAPWQRLKRNLLLILQLLALAGLVFALARPALSVPAVASGSVVVLLDASASMYATDGEPTRFASARHAAQDLIDDLPPDSRLTLILVDSHPAILASAETDKTRLHRALAQASPGQGGADWEAAFALAAGAAGQNASPDPGGSRSATIVILSDGGLPSAGLPPLPGEVRYVPIGQESTNMAISALAMRPSQAGAELFASVSNYGDSPRSAILSFYADGVLIDARRLDLPPGESPAIVISGLPDSPAIYQARLSDPGQPGAPLDHLPLDDVAFAVYQPPGEGRTLLVSSGGNIFLERLLAALPEITPYRALPAESGALQIPPEPFDLYMLDGLYPGELPGGNLLLINPPPNPLFTVGAVFTPGPARLAPDHPLARYVVWEGVHVAQARQVALPDWATVLVGTDEGPLVFAGETGGRRVAVVTFDLHDSDLPLQVAFPILFSNLLSYLVPPQSFEAPAGLAPGESLSILPSPQVEQVVVASPSGQLYSFIPGESGVLFSETGELGVYAVNFLAGDEQRAEYFAVNLFDPLESHLRPAESLQVGRRAVGPSTPSALGQRELWPWLAALALGLLLVEWWVYQRRQGIPEEWRVWWRKVIRT
jgi:Ca-activated chloride channel homolog